VQISGLRAFGYNFAESEPIWTKSKKTQKLLTEFPVLPTSGRHNSAMITDCRKFTSKWSLYGMSSFHFYR